MSISTDHRAVAVSKATERDLPNLSQTLAEAFFTDPFTQWVVPDAARRKEILPDLFAAFVEAALSAGEVYTAGDGAGAALWLPPGGQLGPEDMAGLAPKLEQAMQEYAPILFEFLALLDDKHPPETHFYLFLLGTRPLWQSQGVGSALLKPVLERCDRDGLPAYLEASSQGNQRLYLRHGFQVKETVTLRDSPPMWCMWREPS